MKNKTCRYLTYIFFLFSFSFVTAQELDYEWTHKGPRFSNDLENQVAYINLGDNNIWGWFEITITAGFSHRLAVGKYTKRFSIGKNKGEAGYFYQDSEVPEAFDRVAEQWKIGDLEKDVNGDLRIPIYHIDNKANGLFIKIKGNSPVTVNTDLFSVSDPVTLANEQTRDYVHFKDSRLGIGTASPDTKLEIRGDQNSIPTLGTAAQGQFKIKANNNALEIGVTNVFNGRVASLQSRHSSESYADNFGKLLLNPLGGQVGVGTSDMGSHKLAVEGSIGAREIKVEATGWSDFVFEKEYNLPTLKEVEEHIHKKGHLKDIPSAADVEENGIFLGEMDSKLLQKIEELTLYTIQQEKEIERLKLLEKRLVEIEELLKVKK